MRRAASVLSRRPGLVAAAAIGLTLLALLPASRLRLHTDLPSLLPEESAAATSWRVYLEHFGGIERVFILLTTPEPGVLPAQLAEAAADLAERLEAHPEVVSARAGVTAEDEADYLRRVVLRAPLLLPEDAWFDEVASRLRPEHVEARVRDIRASLLGPSGAFTRDLAIHDPLGFAGPLDLLGASDFGLPVDPLTRAFLSADGNRALLLVEPSGSELDSAAGRRLAAVIDTTRTAAESAAGFTLESRAVGGPLYAAHDETVIRGDLQRTLTGTTLACAALLIAAFGGVGIPLAGLAALVAGMTWLAALLTMLFGGVSAAVIGFAAVLVGLGVDAAIHGGTSLQRHLRDGTPRGLALQRTFSETGPGILAASATTAAGFAVLCLSGLPPLQELGQIIALGLAAVVLSTATLGAATALAAARSRSGETLVMKAIGAVVDRLAALGERFPRLVLGTAAVLTVAALPAALRTEIQPDPRALRPLDNPLIETERLLAETFSLGGETATVVVSGADLDQALDRAAAVRETLEETAPDLAVLSPDRRLAGAGRTAERLARLEGLPFARAAGLLRSELRAAGLDPRAFSPGLTALESFAEGRDPDPTPSVADEQVSEGAGGVTWASISLRAPHDTWDAGPPDDLLAAVEETAPGAFVASMPLVGRDLKEIAVRDLRRLSVLCLLVVAVLVGGSFRGRPAPAFLALVPVVLGTVWALGWWSALGRPIDLVGLAVLPVMLGLGIDDGLYAVHGARTHGTFQLGLSVRRTGRAMVLTTLTTAIGFGSLALSHLPGLRSAAQLAPVAVGACLLATLTVLPAVGRLMGGERDRI